MRIRLVTLLLVVLVVPCLDAVELTQVAGAAHAYPIMLDLNGKTIGPGEYIQSVEHGRLSVTITYHLKNGRVIEEKGTFQQHPEFAQKEWSWQERSGATVQREYIIHFDAHTATARKREHGQNRSWSENIAVEEGQTFAGFGFTLVLENLRDRLKKGEAITLKAVGFTPKPRIVPVKLSYSQRDRVPMSERVLPGEHFLLQPQIPAIAKLFI